MTTLEWFVPFRIPESHVRGIKGHGLRASDARLPGGGVRCPASWGGVRWPPSLFPGTILGLRSKGRCGLTELDLKSDGGSRGRLGDSCVGETLGGALGNVVAEALQGGFVSLRTGPVTPPPTTSPEGLGSHCGRGGGFISETGPEGEGQGVRPRFLNVTRGSASGGR